MTAPPLFLHDDFAHWTAAAPWLATALKGIEPERRPVDGLPPPPAEPCPELNHHLAHLLGMLGGMSAGLSPEAKHYLEKCLRSIRYAHSIHERHRFPIDNHTWRHERWMSVAGQPVYICGPCGKRVVWRGDAWAEDPIPGHDWVLRHSGWVKMPNGVKSQFTFAHWTRKP